MITGLVKSPTFDFGQFFYHVNFILKLNFLKNEILFEILVKIMNFDQKLWSEIDISIKNLSFDQKSKCLSKIKIVFKNSKFSPKKEFFVPKSEILKNNRNSLSILFSRE